MAVYRNYYNRNRNYQSWCVIYIISCLYLLCSTVSCNIVSGDRVRHFQSRKYLDSYEQLERYDADETSSRKPYHHCPNCLYKTEKELKSETDKLRLEAIKSQILSKLGLRHKPNITHSLPKEVVLETLYRAENTNDFFNSFDNFAEDEYSTSDRSTMSSADFDDFYGKTSEIISFAEQGSTLNQNTLLEFQVSPESGQAGQEFRVRTAALWLRADVRNRATAKCRTTEIYVFKIISSRLPESVTLSSSQFDRVTADPISMKLEENTSGWQKLNLTDIVRRWLTESNNDKLRLFVDCSCCSNWHIHLFNNELDKKSNPNRPFLVIHTDPNTAKRVRRRALECTPDSGNQCCKQRFYVSFKALGWDDWVIAPQGYYANYCRGDCGQHRTPDTYVTYHTHVLEEARKSHHLSGMQACCAPLKFSSVSLIYYGPNRDVIKRDLPKMVVDECGCP